MAITINGSGITSANIADGTIVDSDVSSISSGKVSGLKTVGGVSLVGNGDIATLPTGGVKGQALIIGENGTSTWGASLSFLNLPTADGQSVNGLADGSFYVVGGSNASDYPGDFNTTSTSAGSFTIPTGVSEIWIRASATGGNAGGLPYPQLSGPGGTGGRVSQVWAVTSGDVISWSTPNTTGTMSVSFNGNTIITCTGGGQGGNSINGYMGPGGASGASSFAGNPITKNTFQITGFSTMPEGGDGGSSSKTVAYNSGSSGSVSYAYKSTT